MAELLKNLKNMVKKMLPDLTELKFKRKQFNLTQAELAHETGISQSLIAKIESGAVVPAFDKAKKLFDFFEEKEKGVKVKAKNIMNSKIYSVKASATVKDAARLMKKHGVSQLPVFEGERIVGAVSEQSIVAGMQETENVADLNRQKVSEIMLDAMPIIQEETPFDVIAALLEHHSGLLVAKKGKIKGIISKADLLSVILEKRKRIFP